MFLVGHKDKNMLIKTENTKQINHNDNLIFSISSILVNYFENW